METKIWPAVPAGDILCMKTMPTFENDQYDIDTDISYTLWSGYLAVTSGMILEYDLFIKEPLSDYSYFTFVCVDSHGKSHILPHETGKIGFWQHCQVTLNSLYGLNLNEVLLSYRTKDLTKGAVACFDNIRLAINGNTATEIYEDGLPALSYHASIKGLYLGVLTAMPLAIAKEDVRNVRDFGAAADGETDDSQAFQAALFAAKAAGGMVFAPAGTYRICSHLIVPNGVTLHGQGDDTLLLAEEGRDRFHGPAFITTEGTATLEYFSILYPQQRCDCILPYPWTIRSELGKDCRFENITLYNSYNCIKLGTSESSGQSLKNIRMTALSHGLVADCSDHVCVQNLTVSPDIWIKSSHWPVASQEDAHALEQYLNEMLDAVSMGACHDFQLENIQVVWAKSGIQCAESTQVSMWTPRRLTAPNASSGRISRPQLSHVNWGLEMNYLMGKVTVEDGSIQADGPDFPLAIRISKDIAYPVTLRNCLLGSTGGLLEQIGPKVCTTLHGCNLKNWGSRYHCIDAEHGTVRLLDCVRSHEENFILLRTADAFCEIL